MCTLMEKLPGLNIYIFAFFEQSLLLLETANLRQERGEKGGKGKDVSKAPVKTYFIILRAPPTHAARPRIQNKHLKLYPQPDSRGVF